MTAAERRVLLPVDGSGNSTNAFEYYLENIRQDRDTVVFVHCVEPPTLPTLTFLHGVKFPTEDWGEKISKNLHKGEELENVYRKECQDKSIRNEFHIVSSRKPSEGVAHAVEEFKIDIVVMGCRGLSAFNRTILGSVSEYLLHHTSVSVLIVPPKKK